MRYVLVRINSSSHARWPLAGSLALIGLITYVIPLAIGMFAKNHCNLPIKLRNAGQQRAQQGKQGMHHQGTGFHYGRILRQRPSILDLLQLFIQIQRSSRMLFVIAYQ